MEAYHDPTTSFTFPQARARLAHQIMTCYPLGILRGYLRLHHNVVNVESASKKSLAWKLAFILLPPAGDTHPRRKSPTKKHGGHS